MKYALALILLTLRIQAFSQSNENWRAIPSITAWLNEIKNWPEDVYRQDYLEIHIDPALDSLYYSQDHVITDSDMQMPMFEINKELRIYHIRFLPKVGNTFNEVQLKNIHFKEIVDIYNVKNNRIGFKHVTFDKLCQLRLMETRFFFEFNGCRFNDYVNINNPSEPTPFGFYDCYFQGGMTISAIDDSPSLTMQRCKMVALGLPASQYRDILIDSTEISFGLFLVKADVGNSFQLTHSSVGGIEITGSQMPANDSYVPFEQVSGRLGVELYPTFLSTLRGDTIAYYKGESDIELLNTDKYDQLIASYHKLLTIYKARGEMRSYNACYIEMRDKQTALSRLQYEQDPTFNRYFDYQINRFTKAFSDYGTRPAKAIVIFFQVVLGFSVFYFLFPSTWNTTNNRSLMKRLSYLGSYFTSKEGLSDLFEKETKDEYKDYEEFKTFMQSSEKELPVYFKWLSRPLYNASVSRFNLSRSVLRKTDILNGKWSELPSGKKALTSFVIGTYLLFYLIYVLIVRCLNAITLSLNAFSTLGFGEIPTKGIARYVTIIQGFIGWFLLSIFLVSLIGQILN